MLEDFLYTNSDIIILLLLNSFIVCLSYLVYLVFCTEDESTVEQKQEHVTKKQESYKKEVTIKEYKEENKAIDIIPSELSPAPSILNKNSGTLILEKNTSTTSYLDRYIQSNKKPKTYFSHRSKNILFIVFIIIFNLIMLPVDYYIIKQATNFYKYTQAR